MARPPGADDEYAELQKRFQMLENDRKSLFEHTQLEVKKNKEALAKLKKENKELRSTLSGLMSDQGKSSGKDSEIGKLEQQVQELRRRHDDVRHQCQFRQKELQSLQDKLKDLEKEMAKLQDDDTPLTRNIRTLENRLDKAMIKYNEAQSIRKTYEQIVKRLKEERIGFDNQLAAIERTLKAKEKDLEELVLMSHDAQHAKEVAKAELLKLEHQLMEEKKQREKELADRRALVQQKVEMNQRLEKRDKMRREMQLVEGGEQADPSESNMKKTLFSTAFHSALNEHVLEEEQKKITTYEEAFRKIKDATGVSDVNEVIQKFLTQDETHSNLVVMTKEAQARIDALNEEKAQAKAKVEEIKYSGTGSLGSRRIVDEFESHLSEANSKCERNKQKYERIAKILINVKSGVEHLADKLEPIQVDQEAVVMTDSTVVEVLAQCEAKLMRLMDIVEGDQQSAQQVDSHAQDKLLASQEVEMPAYNIRIQIPHDADDDSGDDEVEDDDQEDVPDRDQVKKYSSLMLEKANKKQKRQRKRKVGGEGSAKGTKSGVKRPEMA
ncbi:hypothetical protein GUITHDRAFT_85772 [Guillardia theta CCMP2712]|uniref:ODAD1 central coiled coil region domain-containing protein n=2 Tax=Guillardia theta TaxID=55529 RepID=L1JMU7_GUITC|nr:hypothetical protein GUITHDRAFT_85772 [Guillardia theta CCMP2712]EKX49393.1 hypothetical protein GUITHDRAFT_85772 [Guillardia theta CCMP2712]|eukprot:XP_005836373.1 hypothetical protein GUITHDRAFT_85772 [Guillardia theta CCMP2712]